MKNNYFTKSAQFKTTFNGSLLKKTDPTIFFRSNFVWSLHEWTCIGGYIIKSKHGKVYKEFIIEKLHLSGKLHRETCGLFSL